MGRSNTNFPNLSAGSPPVEERLRTAVHQTGIPLFGIASPEQPAGFDRYTRWLENAGHAGMAYLARPDALESRQNPRKLLEGTQSILVFGFPYTVPKRSTPPHTGVFGHIAGYACSPDYHATLPRRLETLIPAFEEILGRRLAWKIFTDSAPILERGLARAAGLGWIGKNGNLISPQIGSGFLLAELFCDAPLKPAAPFERDRCGSCRRCIEACPIGCINEDRTLDAGRCISYLTIESKDAIPVNLRQAMGSCLFGCDICQQVCPWNRHQYSGLILPEFSRNALPEWLDLHELHQLTAEQFKEQFTGYPVSRAKWQGFLRNACVVMGNSGKPEVLPALQSLLTENPHALVRAHAAWAIGALSRDQKLPAGRQLLQNRLPVEPDTWVQEEIRQAIQG